jgi:hypothetical protein
MADPLARDPVTMTAPGTPRFAYGILDHPVTWLLARLALFGANLIGGGQADQLVAQQALFGMAPPAVWAAATVALERIAPA